MVFMKSIKYFLAVGLILLFFGIAPSWDGNDNLLAPRDTSYANPWQDQTQSGKLQPQRDVTRITFVSLPYFSEFKFLFLSKGFYDLYKEPVKNKESKTFRY